MFDFSGKRALITGASGGIGSEIAESLHLRGATVTLSGTREQALDALASKLGERVHVVVGDLSSVKDAQYLLDAVNNSMGEINILVNNAGITKDKLAMRMTDEDWQFVLEVNLGAVFRLSRGCLRSMIKRRWGRIVNITSIFSIVSKEYRAPYSASKFGMDGMTASLAAEVAESGVLVNSVAPGFIDTELTRKVLGEQDMKEMAERVPIRRMGNPKEVARLVLWLASNENTFVSAQNIAIDGGFTRV